MVITRRGRGVTSDRVLRVRMKRTDRGHEEGRVERKLNRVARKRKSPGGEEERRKKRRVVAESRSSETSEDDPRAEFEAKYFELNRLGRGGCGSVFAGYCRENLSPVAIKYVPERYLYCKQVYQGKTLPAEVAIMQKLAEARSSPGEMSTIVSLLDWYDLGHELILVLERPIGAIDLQRYINNKGGILEEMEAKSIMKQLVDTALDLERNNIFHRDIKPENILIDPQSSVPRVYLIDFGLSCIVKKGSFFSVFYGTEKYATPEYCSSSVYRPGPSTVWQLGTVLYEMLHKVKFKTPRFLKNELTISNVMTNDIKNFLQQCLQKDPKQRPTLTELKLHSWLQ